MITINDLVPGQLYTNNEIVDAFMCSTQGGMRRSHRTNTLVIFASHNKPLYEDRWQGDVLHYTGMGRIGNQTFVGNQNDTLAHSDTNGVTVHLYESYQDKIYVYDGIVKLTGKPYFEDELDDNYEIRKVIKFPLKIVKGEIVVPTKEMIEKCKEEKLKKIQKLSDKELNTAAKNAGSKNPKKRNVNTTTYDRDEVVVENTKRRANGICDLCGNKAPFKNKNNEYYLECHHVIRLSNDGPDKIYNTVALCPNCHRKMHVRNDKIDNKKLIIKIGEYLYADGDQQMIDEYKILFKL